MLSGPLHNVSLATLRIPTPVAQQSPLPMKRYCCHPCPVFGTTIARKTLEPMKANVNSINTNSDSEASITEPREATSCVLLR